MMDCTTENVNLIKDSNCKNSLALILKFYGIDCVDKHTLNLRKLRKRTIGLCMNR